MTAVLSYAEARPDLRSGDVVALRGRGSLIGWLVDAATRSSYDHIGLVWRVASRVFLLEATPWAGVGIRSLSSVGSFDWISAGVDWTPSREDRAIADLEMPYAYLDALRLGLGLRPSRNGLVCSLFVADVLGLPRDAATPGYVVDRLTRAGANLSHIIG